MATTLFIVIAYLIGSLSFAVVVSKAFGLPDPHTYGSGNPGATNVLRTGNRLAALLTLTGDALKGWMAVRFAEFYASTYGVGDAGIAGVAFAVFLGHLYPVYFGFKGGKGVATAAGILLALNAWLGLATLATWLAMAAIFRYSSLAAITAAVAAPIYALFLLGANVLALAVLGLALLLVARHRENIRKLMAGQESRIGEKKKAAGATA